MEYIASISVAVIIAIIILVGVIQKKEIFVLFTAGALEGLKLH